EAFCLSQGKTLSPQLVSSLCIDDAKQLAHASHQRDLAQLAACPELLVVRLHQRVPSHGRERGQVQRDADRSTSTPDPAFALTLPAVPVHWRHASEFCDLTTVEVAEFR